MLADSRSAISKWVTRVRFRRRRALDLDTGSDEESSLHFIMKKVQKMPYLVHYYDKNYSELADDVLASSRLTIFSVTNLYHSLSLLIWNVKQILDFILDYPDSC